MLFSVVYKIVWNVLYVCIVFTLLLIQNYHFLKKSLDSLKNSVNNFWWNNMEIDFWI